ncbi:DUF1722 domain-containing protein [Neptunicella sp. SCSIO 80796]|uniref:DUF1722 domain-containing protein n=1 Tax=Neptunicella plasticusilytica TaxID=3117012 RepID=UPI003A4DB622
MNCENWIIHPGYLTDSDLLLAYEGAQALVTQEPSCTEQIFRYNMLAAEIILRQLADIKLLSFTNSRLSSSRSCQTSPYQQFEQLRVRYQNKISGRILLPANAQQLWSQHKYSIMARDVNLYKRIGREVAQMKPATQYSELALLLTQQLSVRPGPGGIYNALQHMWGYVSAVDITNNDNMTEWSASELLLKIQLNTLKIKQFYLLSSTALSELYVWIATKP